MTVKALEEKKKEEEEEKKKGKKRKKQMQKREGTSMRKTAGQPGTIGMRV